MGPAKRQKQLTSSQSSTHKSLEKSTDKYHLSNTGPAIQKKASALVGKSINEAASASRKSQEERPTIASNARPPNKVTSTEIESSLSGITSAADQFNSYRFDESSALKTYKKIMMIHLKDDMFHKIKFITNDAMLEYSRNPETLCGYVCTKMKVPGYQWGEYWDLVKQTTKKMIEHQRTNATSAVKKGFRGKCNKIYDMQYKEKKIPNQLTNTQKC
jgi:hypothetical protein